MSKTVLISIYYEHLAKILSGDKVFEYRKVMPSQGVSHLVFYCTHPVKKVVAVAEVTARLDGPPSRIWSDTGYGAGITRKYYRDYFTGRKSASCFALGNVYELTEPLEFAALSSCKVPPQSFCYLNDDDTEKIFNKLSDVPSNPSSLIFVGGIHGVGKTTIGRKAFEPLGYHCVTASSLISAYGCRTDTNKRVDNVSNNQHALVEQLALEKKRHCRILLDGHFTLINSQEDIEPIDCSVFQKMHLTHLILFKGDPAEIARRLEIRDGRKWSSEFISAFQDAEERHARHVSDSIGIPLQIIENTDSPAKIAKSVSRRS
jgi:adenylate kinase